MRIASAFVLLAVFAVPTLAQDAGTEEKALRELWGRFEEAYNQSDAAEVASLYAPNSDRINGVFQLVAGVWRWRSSTKPTSPSGGLTRRADPSKPHCGFVSYGPTWPY